MAIRFYLQNDEKQVLMLPVNPSNLKVAKNGKNKSVEIVELGMVNILRGMDLASIKLDCFLPANAYPPYVLTKDNFVKPQTYIDFIEKARKNRKPIRLVVSDVGVNMLVSIESFDYQVKAQDDDVHYAITLKEYRTFKSKIVTIQKPTNKKPIATSTNNNRQKTGFAAGDTVRVTGKWWYNSYGASPFGYAPNGFVGKISHLNRGASCPFHITDMNGGWKGWVTADQLTHT